MQIGPSFNNNFNYNKPAAKPAETPTPQAESLINPPADNGPQKLKLSNTPGTDMLRWGKNPKFNPFNY